ncbi:MAG: hypothetical protein JEZ12_23730 [Desulfobacterium sp.]|nr:hypothetical protein [Desulfobacterium sp.]
MKLLRLVMLVICVVVFTQSTSFAIPKSVKAKSEYILAKKAYDQNDFPGAIEHATNSKILLGETKSRIEYLLVKAYYKGHEFDKALESLEMFFNVTPESESASEQYNEMVVLYSEIEESKKLQLKKLDLEKQKQLEEERIQIAKQAAEKKKRDAQLALRRALADCKDCESECEVKRKEKYNQAYANCYAAARSDDASPVEVVGELFEFATLGILDTGTTVDEYAKTCVQNAYTRTADECVACIAECKRQYFLKTNLRYPE